jgi:hypothetical protein
MAFVHSKSARVLLNEMSVSGKLHAVSMGHSREVSEATVFTDSGATFLPGLRSGALSLSGRWETAGVGTLQAEIAAATGVDDSLLVSAAPEGFAVGNPVFICVGDLSGYTVDATVSDVVGFQLESTPDDGVDWGVAVHDLGAETANGNSTGVDNTTSSANGGVGSVHVTAYTGLTNIVVKIQHSTDNSTYADLITFTTATGVTSQRSTVTGTVNRYVRALWTVSGTGSATFAAAFARR